MELSVKQRLFYFIPVLFCFCLPFGSLLLSALIILWGITSFFNIEKTTLQNGLKNRNLWLLWGFFLITCMSAFFSENKEEALFSMEIKLSFVFLPFYFFCFKWPAAIIKKCLVAFVSGCFFACMYLIARASLYSFNGQPEYFYYTSFSDFIHASSFSMYLVLAISIIVLCYYRWFRSQKQVIYFSVFFVLVFILTIFLCSSKMGIISLFVMAPVLILYRWRSFFNLKKGLLLMAAIILIIIAVSKIFPEPFERLRSVGSFSFSNIDKTTSESTAVRALIWEQSLYIIKNNFLFGVTVGDANDELYKAYEQNGMSGALTHRLNAHNQFLQTFIGLGIGGFLMLLMLTFGYLIKSFIKKNIFLLVFSLLIILSFMVESMLQRSDGTLFFVFFFCLFNFPKIRDEII